MESTCHKNGIIGGDRILEVLLKHYENTGFDVFLPSYGIKSL